MVPKHTIFSANNQVVDNTKSWSIYKYMLINDIISWLGLVILTFEDFICCRGNQNTSTSGGSSGFKEPLSDYE